ncbi:SurA N-terminal domain-containing protein [Luteolibacter sp. LG18]|uniref:SurA N-terminal domain-containing protein n=1 Tax=Luteolibacter sp. LG18 TaxID=2819286 RepID=UPI002B325823|nr:hypothetical protein llg_00520 [Luteolibacter sp. LG18]
MIENIRNYYGLMMVVLVALFLSFLFTGFSGSKAAMGGGQAYIRIDGTTYDTGAYQKQGIEGRKLAMGLQMYEFVSNLNGFGGRGDDDESSESFFINRMLVRQAGEQFGIHPSKDELAAYVKEMSAFAGKDGKYDPVTYKNIVQKGIGRLGMVEPDLLELVSDAVIARKLGEILGSGLGVNRQVVADSSALNRQLISVQLGKIALAPFKDTIKPTDDEVKAYWDTIQDSFKTEEKRKFTYILATPQLPEAKPEEQKPDAEKKPEDAANPAKPDPTKEDPKLIEERRKKENELTARVDDLFNDIQNKKGGDFEALAKEQGFEIKTTELFPLSQAPADLSVTLRSSGGSGRAVDTLFNIKQTSDPISKFSDPIAVGTNQWIVARLDTVEESRTKTFEEAKEQAKAQYIEEKAREAMRKDADEKLKKIREAITGGKSFADAAKDAGLETKPFGPVTMSTRPTGDDAPASLFRDVSTVDPGTVADVVAEPTQAFIVFVEKREVEKIADSASRLDSEVTNAAGQNRMRAFIAWLADRTEAAKVEHLYKKNS